MSLSCCLLSRMINLSLNPTKPLRKVHSKISCEWQCYPLEEGMLTEWNATPCLPLTGFQLVTAKSPSSCCDKELGRHVLEPHIQGLLELKEDSSICFSSLHNNFLHYADERLRTREVILHAYKYTACWWMSWDERSIFWSLLSSLSYCITEFRSCTSWVPQGRAAVLNTLEGHETAGLENGLVWLLASACSVNWVPWPVPCDTT
jgi:hypothetical protein